MFNSRFSLASCLKALLACEESDLEIIVVDDGSTDGTADCAATFPVRVLRQPENRGQGAARNRAAAEAAGSILVFLDADVEVETDLFVRLRTFFKVHPEAAGVSGHYAADTRYRSLLSTYKNLYLVHSFEWMLGPVGVLNTSLAAVRRDSFLLAGGFDERLRFGEDSVLGGEMHARGMVLLIDHDIRMRHVKEYGLVGLLRDTYNKSRAMAEYLWSRGDNLPKLLVQRSGHHHSPLQIARVPIGVVLALSLTMVVAARTPSALAAFAAALLVFILAIWPLSTFLARHGGRRLAVLGSVVHGMEMVVAGAAVARAALSAIGGVFFSPGTTESQHKTENSPITNPSLVDLEKASALDRTGRSRH